MIKFVISRLITIILFALIFVLFIKSISRGASIAPLSPLAAIKQTITDLKSIVSDPKLKGAANEKQRRDKIREIILSCMDFEEMGKRAMGRHWVKLNKTQRYEYLEVFAEFMEAYYREQIFNSVEFLANDLIVKYGRENIDGEYAEVSVVFSGGNSTIKTLIKLRLLGNRWKVYDMVIEDISMVQNWRSQFDRIFTKESYSGLIRALENKIREFNGKK